MIDALADSPQLAAFWRAHSDYNTPANRQTLVQTLRAMMQSPSNSGVKLETLTTPEMLARIFEATKSQYESKQMAVPTAVPIPVPTEESANRVANPQDELPPELEANPLAECQTLPEAIRVQERLAVEAREDYQRRKQVANANLGQSEGQRRMNQTFERVRHERGNLP